MHARMRSVSSRRARAGTSGSEISARVIPTRSQAPSTSAASAISGQVDPPFGDDGQPGRRALGTSRERHPVAGLELHRRHDQEGLLVVAVSDADVVDLTARREVGDRFLVSLHGRGHGDPEQALRADLGPQRLQDLAREAGTPFQRPP